MTYMGLGAGYISPRNMLNKKSSIFFFFYNGILSRHFPYLLVFGSISENSLLATEKRNFGHIFFQELARSESPKNRESK